MTAFAYSSILVAIIFGMVIKELLQRITNILSRENGLALYWFEAFFTALFLYNTVGVFFSYHSTAGSLDSITVTNFLGPIILSCLWYILMFFFPVPKKEDGAIDVEAHFISKAPRWLLFTVCLISSVHLDS